MSGGWQTWLAVGLVSLAAYALAAFVEARLRARRWRGRTCTAGTARLVAHAGPNDEYVVEPCAQPAAWSSPDTGDLCGKHRDQWRRL